MDLFDSALVPANSTHLPKNIILRPLKSTDFEKGVAECLGELSSINGLNERKFAETFRLMLESKHYYVIVCEDLNTKKIIAMGTLFVETKFLRGGGRVGHIEDIVVQKAYRGFDIGKTIICSLRDLARELSCYKAILDCADKNVSFYEKCGFRQNEVQMAFYLVTKAKTVNKL